MKTHRYLVGIVLAVAVAVSSSPLVLANESHGKNVSRAYQSTQPIEPASIVALKEGSDTVVEPATPMNQKRLLGVVVPNNYSLIELNENDASNVPIALAGSVEVYVTDIAGEIKTGDKVAVSPFSGLGMKSSGGKYVIGLAVSDFDPNAATTRTISVNDANNQPQSVRAGLVTVAISIGVDEQNSQSDTESGIQGFVQRLTGRSVSLFRIVLGLLIALITIIALTVLLYASIYGSIISIGRNPLAKNVILRGLVFVFGLGLIMAVASFLIVFLLLR